MQAYTLVTVWHLDASLEQVWQILSCPEGWPGWWPYVEKVEVVSPGDPETGIGLIHRHSWSTCLPYRLNFELTAIEITAPFRVKTRVSGDLVGIGCCRLRCRGTLTLVRFDWHVHTTKAWMNILAPFARPIFLWNHQRVMAAGEAALRTLLASASGPLPLSSTASVNREFGTPLRHSK